MDFNELNRINNFNHNNEIDISKLNEISESKLNLYYKNLNENLVLKTGLLGKFFGSTDNTAIHIAGIAVLLLIIGGIFSFFSTIYNDYWKIATPIVTSCLGYIFGKIK